MSETEEKPEVIDAAEKAATVIVRDLTVKDLNPKKYPTDGLQNSNLLVLCQRLNQVQKIWGRQFVVTSGLRSEEQQRNLIKAGKTKATKSKHLTGHAADIYDPDGSLKAFLLNYPNVLIEANLWCEHGDYTPNWCHFQIVPPGSGNRWFKP
jgi:uncharacterized protein YcbK (DUF882 family)